MPGAASYVVSREVDGGTRWWRGRVDHPGTTFTDASRSGRSHQYYVTPKYPDGTFGDVVSCGDAITAP